MALDSEVFFDTLYILISKIFSEKSGVSHAAADDLHHYTGKVTYIATIEPDPKMTRDCL